MPSDIFQGERALGISEEAVGLEKADIRQLMGMGSHQKE